MRTPQTVFSLVTTLLTPLALLGCIATGERTVEVETRSLGVLELDALEVDVGEGDLELLGDPSLEMVEATVTLRTSLNEVVASDDDAARALEVTLEERAGRAFLSVHLVDAPVGYHADVRVRLPSRLAVDCRDGSGDIVVASVRSLRLADESGDIEVDGVEGEVDIDDDSGEIDVRSTASLSIADTSGGIRVDGVDGPLVIADDSGDIDVAGVSADVDITDDSGGIVVRDALGTVRIHDGSGDILVENVGGFELIEDGSGEVEQR
jgi:hypothetical protein